jgi:hypothetical protein
LGEPKLYRNKKEFDADYKKHLVSPSDKEFYIKDNGIKYGYPVFDVKPLKRPQEISSRGIISRKLRY